ncbi:MAG: 50S ribosomal protein L25 [Candidatus Eremiobacteraeota bacterium]|nr:50S ribosomal protein L25 [Candidatus Eremiobacteraeota bacterium]
MASKDLKLTIEPRAKVGTTGANALRHSGKIPAVLYGHGAAPEHLAIDAHAFEELLHHGGRNAIVTLTGGAKKSETALVRVVQYHPLSHRVIHADLQRVSAKENITAKLPVVTVGVARGVRELGGVMDVVTHELEVEGPADRIPEHLEVDVSELGIHEHIVAGDVKIRSGFKMVTAPDTIVVSIEPSRTERELEEAAEAPAEAPEPEVIGETRPAETEP